MLLKISTSLWHAICQYPLGFRSSNADFDGDQIAVHIPLSLIVQDEACSLFCRYCGLYFHTNSRYVFQTLFIDNWVSSMNLCKSTVNAS